MAKLALVLLASSFFAHAAVKAPPLPENLGKMLNQQINDEFQSAYMYLGLANHFHAKGLDGFGKWCTAQFYEEVNHARGIIDFLTAKSYPVQLKEIPSVSLKVSVPIDAFQISLQQEESLSVKLSALLKAARAAESFDTEALMQEYVKEQVEEEDQVKRILDKLELVGKSGDGILLLDKELGSRALPKISL